MACYHPLIAWELESGAVAFRAQSGAQPITLPCNRCIGCRISRAESWTVRCIHEARTAGLSCFATLTYDDLHLPPGGSLKYADFQAFLKRLRRHRDYRGLGKISFFVGGEYGEKTLRPHYHALLFGYFPDDRVPYPSKGDFPFWESAELSKLWGNGRANFGLVTPESAAYTAKYCTKKLTGDAAAEAYTRVSPDGELYQVKPEFGRMSLNPAIGLTWLKLYGQSDVYAHDKIVINGRTKRVPKFYDSKMDPEKLEAVKLQRKEKNSRFLLDNTDARLAVRETCTKAKLQRKETRL